jgi:lysophospholipase L1-like esterase
VTFLGFEVGGELLDPPERPTRRIQIVGDSIAAGEGVDVESASECSGDWSQDQQFTDMGKTFGPMLAKELDAEVHVIAWSGKGLYLNYDDTWDDRLMPELYELLYLEDKAEDAPKWDHTLFAPDAVLIELGTNDFGPSVTGDRTIDDVTPFVDAYITFVDTLLEYYPDVEIFALSSHLLEASRNDKLIEALDLLETSYADQGIDRVHAITDIKKVGAKGCNGHPNVEQHQAMADELEPTIKDVMGW